AQADSVVRTRKVKVSRALWRSLEVLAPPCKVSAVAPKQSMEQERRERKVVHHVSLVAPAKVGYILLVRDVCLRDQERGRLHNFENITKEFYRLVRLRQVYAGRTDNLPQERHSIEPQYPRPFAQ